MSGRSPSNSPQKDSNNVVYDNPSSQEQTDGSVNETVDIENGVKLYIGNLDYNTNEQRLRDVFSEFGDVIDIFIPVVRATKRSRGFAFVTLDSQDAAALAITQRDQTELDGRTIRVNESRPRGQHDRSNGGFNMAGHADVKLYVGNLPFDADEATIRDLFARFGQVVDYFRPTEKNNGKVRGFAFITMSAEDAEKASHELDGEELDGRIIRVKEAQPKGRGRRYHGYRSYNSQIHSEN
jgi:nucleolin